jgi:hypothetical protein
MLKQFLSLALAVAAGVLIAGWAKNAIAKAKGTTTTTPTTTTP